MQIILKPLSHPQLDEIIIKDCLFAIGRHEAPFSEYDAGVTEKLSRRHARIFEQDGHVYLADLGSLNGTSVGGRRVDRIPARLQRGDEICFAALCYQIEILGASGTRVVDIPSEPPLRLILRPEKSELALEPIVVTEFPFLINKNSAVFARYKERLSAEVSYLSRRHAHIFTRNNQLYIEDLGSTNGTFVQGERLEEHARQLKDGDRIAFGGKKFVYRVELLQEAATETQAAPNDDPSISLLRPTDDITKTTFVTSADSFLDIFCAENEGADEEDEENPDLPSTSEEQLPARGLRGVVRRSGSLVRQMRAELRDEEGANPRRARIALAAGLAVCALAVGMYLNNASERGIREQLEQGAYLQAAQQADRYLQDYPEDRAIRVLATEAMLKATVPAWMDNVLEGEFDTASQSLAGGRELSEFNPDALQLLDLMQWVTNLERFIAQRGGADAPVVMFEHEGQINALLSAWDADATEHRHRLELVTRHVPEFSALRALTFSHIRTLRNQKSLELAAIERLLLTVESTLQEDNPTRLTPVLNEFVTRYPRIIGVEKLQSDLKIYLAIDAARQAEEWLQAQRLATAARLQTTPFQSRVQALLESELPSTEFIERYNAATAAWQAGQLSESIALLDQLRHGPWGKVAQRQLERNSKIQQAYIALLEAKDKPDYKDLLLEFYNGLDPQQDGFFTQALAQDMQRYSKTALAEAQQALKDAQKAWERYRNSGGIRGLQRLEPNVSAPYRQLATTLSVSYDQITRGMRVYKLLNASYSDDWDKLNAEIVNEVMLQRRSLAELAMVLEPGLKQAKLDLLPEPPVEQMIEDYSPNPAVPDLAAPVPAIDRTRRLQ